VGQYNLEYIFKPLHIAVECASEKAGTIGNALMKNLVVKEMTVEALQYFKKEAAACITSRDSLCRAYPGLILI
jgi:hypothetical protein